ncbi:conserved protein of unknown function [Pararobbsia alpina]|uniref:hypothetical protein n=1 Tax=Pararobbsia alpina TaxID=621374 RepID=UPI0039A451BD
MKAIVIINGRELGPPQVLVLRAAIMSMRTELAPIDSLGDDAQGHETRLAYLGRLGELARFLDGEV